MADKLNKAGKPNPPGPKKGAAAPNSRLEQAQKRAQAMTSGSGRKPTPPGQFFQEAWVELKKTTWPTREVLIKSTTVVLALVVATAIFVGIADTILTRITGPLFNLH